jgi:hypothetical protein
MLFHIAVVGGNRSARGSARAFQIELVDIPGLNEPVTRALDAGPSPRSVDELLGASPDAKRKAPKRDAARAVILRELANGPQRLDRLKAVCAAETGCSSETAWMAANALKAEGLATCHNSGPATPWLWQLTSYGSQDLTTNSDDPEPAPSWLTSEPDPFTLSPPKVTNYVTKSNPDFLTSYPQESPQGEHELNGSEP